MTRSLALCLLASIPSVAMAQEFSSEPEILTFQAYHPVVDQGLNFPIGFDLDLLIDTYWIGIDISLQGLANFGLVMEGESNITWDSRDGNDGTVYQVIEPLTGANSIGVEGEANFVISFDIRQGGSSGNPIISIGLLSESALFDVETRDFVPFLLPGQNPSYETVTTNSSDASIRLPFNIDILDLGIFSIGAGFEVIGYPTVSATINGDSLATIFDGDVYQLDGNLRPVPMQLYEATPAMDMQSAYVANIQAFIGYVVNANMSFSVTLFGTDILPINIPLFDQTFPLFTGSDRVDFPSLEYSHPLPVASIPVDVIDFGEVELEDAETFTVPFNNEGELEIIGLVGMTGDMAFGASPVELYAGPGRQAALIVSFTPEVEGEYSGTLLVETSDPFQPMMEIPMRGTAIKRAASENPFGEDNNTVVQDDSSTLYSTCGCAATTGAPSGTLPAAGLLGLLALRRRRRD